jgi:hypothetical protein
MSTLSKFVLVTIQLLLCSLLAAGAFGDDVPLARTELEEYEVQLNAVLRTRLDEEKAYVHDVLDLVRRGKLPRKLVDKSLVWVRENCDDEDNLFVYFEQVLRRQAQRLRFDLPRFDYDVYDASNR